MMQASAGCAASSCKSLWLTGSSLPCEAVPLWTTLDLRRAAEGWSEHIADHPNSTQHRGREAARVARSKVPRHTLIGCYQEDCEPRVWNTAPRRESGRSSAPTGDRQVTIPTFSCGPVIGSPPHHPPLINSTSRERSSHSCSLKGAEAHSYRMLSRGLRTACVEHRTSTGERPQ